MAFDIKLAVLSSLSAGQIQLAANAVARWERAITGSGASSTGQSLAIDLMLGGLGAPGVHFAETVITATWSATGLPRTAEIRLERQDVDMLTAQGRLQDIIAHEVGHCLGFGLLWNDLLLAQGAEGTVFTGARARAEYALLLGAGAPVAGVPVEESGVAGQHGSHWRESLFGHELMTAALPSGGNRLSRLTLASLEDLGYQVDMAAADSYALTAVPAGLAALNADAADGWERPGSLGPRRPRKKRSRRRSARPRTP